MKLVAKINTIFISLILTIMYITVIGLAKCIQIFTKKQARSAHTYWLSDTKKTISKASLLSSY